MRFFRRLFLLASLIMASAVSSASASFLLLGEMSVSSLTFVNNGPNADLTLASATLTATSEQGGFSGLTSMTVPGGTMSFAGASATGVPWIAPLLFASPGLLTFTTTQGSFTFDAMGTTGAPTASAPYVDPNYPLAWVFIGSLSGTSLPPRQAFLAFFFDFAGNIPAPGGASGPAWVLADTSRGSVPEPASLAMWSLLGTLGLVARKRTLGRRA